MVHCCVPEMDAFLIHIITLENSYIKVTNNMAENNFWLNDQFLADEFPHDVNVEIEIENESVSTVTASEGPDGQHEVPEELTSRHHCRGE